jgi:glycosyltransferase involved in cell wall biosynthesis
MRDIQIICVNDGSTDGSRDILQEYANHDDRIQIIDQANRGTGCARNAAYPHIKGQYTLFADSDDWLELDLCEQAVRRIEETDADIVCFRHFVEEQDSCKPSSKFCVTLPVERVETKHRRHMLRNMNHPWSKLWRTAFIHKNNIRCSEMMPYEDILLNWKGCILANKIALIDEMLYHYRNLRPGSAGAGVHWKYAAIFAISDEIRNMLKRIGKYDEYKEVFLAQRLVDFFGRANVNISKEDLPAYLNLVRHVLTDEDKTFLQTIPEKSTLAFLRNFYADLV